MRIGKIRKKWMIILHIDNGLCIYMTEIMFNHYEKYCNISFYHLFDKDSESKNLYYHCCFDF